MSGNIMLSGSSSAAAAGGGKKGKGAPSAPAPKKSSVIYLGRIPHGFYEEQMRGYFEQFGEVTRLRLSRSKKTAKSRGYAFIEFKGSFVESRKLWGIALSLSDSTL